MLANPFQMDQHSQLISEFLNELEIFGIGPNWFNLKIARIPKEGCNFIDSWVLIFSFVKNGQKARKHLFIPYCWEIQ